jgi:carbamoyl-phosphate synthase large subunit
MKNYRDLDLWKTAMELSEQVYRATARLPREERFGLSSQMRRSAVSIPSCIAEGYGRTSLRDRLRFLSAARGSLFELETQAQLAWRLAMIDEVGFRELEARFRKVGQLLSGTRRYLLRELARARR